MLTNSDDQTLDYRLTLGDRGPPFARYVIQYGVDPSHVTRLDEEEARVGPPGPCRSCTGRRSICRAAYYACLTAIVAMYAVDVCVLARRTTAVGTDRAIVGRGRQHRVELEWHWAAHLSLCTAASVLSVVLVAALIVRVLVASSPSSSLASGENKRVSDNVEDDDDENERVLRCVFTDEEDAIPHFVTSRLFITFQFRFQLILHTCKYHRIT